MLMNRRKSTGGMSAPVVMRTLLKELRSVIRCRVKPINGAYDWQPQWAMEGQFNAVVSFDEPQKTEEISISIYDGRKPLQVR